MLEFQEPDRKKRIKRIIAREGLIILAIIGIGYIIIAAPELYIKLKPIRIEQGTDKETPIDLLTESRITYLDTGERKIYRLSEIENITKKQERVRNIGYVILLLAYPLYLLIRFILWAIKTLKEK